MHHEFLYPSSSWSSPHAWVDAVLTVVLPQLLELGTVDPGKIEENLIRLSPCIVS
jgi:hypothetical protein